jgi:chromosomal replication initiator protein
MAFATSQAPVHNPWLQILAALEKKVIRQSFETWLKPTRYSHAAGRTLYVRVPSPEFQHIGDKYGDLIQEAIDLQSLEFDDVSFVTAEEDPSIPPQRKDGGFGPLPAHAPTAPPAPSRSPEQGKFDWSTAAQLNPRYTFDAFVIGNGNQFARAASLAVAERPSRAYNPLFLYGGVGMGKTHLMHAIGRALISRGSTRVIYTTSERFTNEVVSGIKHGKMPQLRARYRTADVLLIDDIQSLGSKDRTQEEFFHTFNELHDAQKQIVISSDCPPKDIGGLVERLRSRFEWGLMADIQPPDLETKMAILEKKAELEGTRLPHEVCTFIAEKTKSNVRELEGALVKLVAYSSLTRTTITITMARQVLKHLLEKQDRRITIESVQKAVAEKYAIKLSQLREKSNRKEIVGPRQVAMYLVKELTNASLPEIGRAFGGKHHTTVIHSINKIGEQRANDPDLNKLINSVTDSFQ